MKPNRPFDEHLLHTIRDMHRSIESGGKEDIPQPQSISSTGLAGAGVSVVGQAGGGTFAIPVTAQTTLTGSGPTPSGATVLNVASGAALAAGQVIAVGAVVGASGGALPICEIQWVTAVSGNQATIAPGLVNPWPTGTAVSVVPAVQALVQSAQDPTGIDLGLNVMASATADLNWPGASVQGFLYVAAIRTGLAYFNFSQTPNYTISPTPGPQVTRLSSPFPAGSATGTQVAAGTLNLTLEAAVPWFDTTITTGINPGGSAVVAAAIPASLVGTSFEAMLGDEVDPPELVFGTATSTTAFTCANGAVALTTSTGPTYAASDATGANVYILCGSGSTWSITRVVAGVATTGWASLAAGVHDGIAVDQSSGNIYVTNLTTGYVEKITPAGVVSSTWASVNPEPFAICVDGSGNVFTVNAGASGLGPLTVSKVTSAATVTATWATIPTGSNPTAIVTDSSGNVYVCDQTNARIIKITSAAVLTANWAVLAAGLNPTGMCIDSNGNLYTANYSTPGSVSQVTSAGVVTNAWATFPVSVQSYGITVDTFGNVYVLCPNGAATVVKVDSNQSIIDPWLNVPGATYGDFVLVAPNGMVYVGYGATGTVMASANLFQTEFSHPNGAQFESVVSTGQSPWTFFPVVKTGGAANTVTFNNITLTIDPR